MTGFFTPDSQPPDPSPSSKKGKGVPKPPPPPDLDHDSASEEVDIECWGIFFRYFLLDAEGGRHETKNAKHFALAEDQIIFRLRRMLSQRPDLMDRITCLEEGLEVQIHEGSQFLDFESETYFFGRVTRDGDLFVLELAADEVLFGGKSGHTALDVVIHEITHILDYLDEMDGFLPGWDEEMRHQFATARLDACQLIHTGESPLDPYALSNDEEFIAVLTETFFRKPKELNEAHPFLYQMMGDYFNVDPLTQNPLDFPDSA